MRLFILLVLYLISISFYQFFAMNLLRKDLIIVASVLLIIVYFPYVKRSINIDKDKFIFLFFLWGIVGSVIMAFFNFDQPISYSLRATRPLLALMLMFVALHILLKAANLELIKKFLFFNAIFIFALYFYIYFTGDFSFFSDELVVLERLGEIRIVLAASTMVFLIFYFYLDSQDRKISYLPFGLMLVALLIVDKTRAIILGIGVLLIIVSVVDFKKKNYISMFFAFFVIVIASVLVTNYESSILFPLTDLISMATSEISAGTGNVNVRKMELIYFWGRMDFWSIIFGYGMDNQLFRVLYPSNFFLSDIGLFKVFYLHGIVGFILFLALHMTVLKESLKGNTMYHKLGMVLVIYELTTPTMISVYLMSDMLLYFSTYIVIKKINDKEITV